MEAKNNKKVVLVWDSGVGGFSVLKELERNIRGVKFVYYADIQNAPYGDKSVEKLRLSVLPKMDNIVKNFKPNCIVLACNTITATLIEDIREKYKDLIIVGTEPAIKPAMKLDKEILLMMTPTTFENCELVENLRDSNINTYWVLDKRLAMIIQNNLDNKCYIKLYLSRLLSKYKNKDMVVVLGCTHYVLVKDIIQDVLGKKAKIIDSTQGVINRVKQLLDIRCEDMENELEIIGDSITIKVWNILRGTGLCVE